MEFEKLQEIIAEVLDMDPGDIAMDSGFKSDLGADSLDLMEIVMKLEDELAITISDEDLEGIVTVADAMEAIRNA